MDSARFAPATRLVASTGRDYCYKNSARASSLDSDKESTDNRETEHLFDDDHGSSDCSSLVSDVEAVSSDSGIFRSLLWSADGTTLITTSADNTVRSFILPPSLLVPASNHYLTPYSTHKHPSSVYATAISPYYSLSSPETALILASPCSLPIRLFSPFASGTLASYPLVNPSTEEWIAPHSLLFTSHVTAPDGRFAADSSLRFLAGSRNQISLFDISREGNGPMTVLATAPSNRKSRRGGGNGMAGIVSAMAMSVEGILAAGTFSRGVGLYDAQGMGDTIGTWNLKDGEEGAGVTSLCWSRCGRYLIAAERGSDGLGIWDIRGTGRKLAWLQGRAAMSMQRLSIALGSGCNYTQTGEDVYAGGTDGIVRVWHDLGMKEGQIEDDWHWQAHEDAVTGIGIHSCGSVFATCSGSRKVDTDGASSDDDSGIDVCNPNAENARIVDKSVRVWNLESVSLENEKMPP